jgi:hypothetical protein
MSYLMRAEHCGLLSVEEGKQLGLLDAQINSEDNLAAMCKACNSGRGDRSVPLWLAEALFRARIIRAAGAA